MTDYCDNDNESIASKDTFAVEDNDDTETANKNVFQSRKRKNRSKLSDESRKRKNDRERRRRQRIRDACEQLVRFIPNLELNHQKLHTKEQILEKAAQYLAHLSNCQKNACDDFKCRSDSPLDLRPINDNAIVLVNHDDEQTVDCGFDATDRPKDDNALVVAISAAKTKSSLSTVIEKIASMKQRCKLVDCALTPANEQLPVFYRQPEQIDDRRQDCVTGSMDSPDEEELASEWSKRKPSKQRRNKFVPQFKN